MKERYVVDTNVLIAASAGDPQDPKDIDATPEDPSLRLKIFCWLEEFRASPSRLVFDDAWKIYREYTNKLNDQDFGIQVVIHKLSTSAVDNVRVEYDDNGHGCLPGGTGHPWPLRGSTGICPDASSAQSSTTGTVPAQGRTVQVLIL